MFGIKATEAQPTARGPLQGATEGCTPVQYTVLAEIPATNPADAHSPKKFGLNHNRAPLQTPPRQLQAALQQLLPHRVLLRATPSTTCTAKIPCVAPTASTACTTKAIRVASNGKPSARTRRPKPVHRSTKTSCAHSSAPSSARDSEISRF
jgi:hypothetical protein